MVQDDVSHRKVGWNLRSGFYRVVSSKLRDLRNWPILGYGYSSVIGGQVGGCGTG